jgi:plasmid replication initiation protein
MVMTDNISNIENKLVIPKNKFIEASYYLTTNEQKILRILASMVNKGDTEFKKYEFKVEELGELLGINKKNVYRDLEKTANLLMSRAIKIRHEGKKRESWEIFHIISKAACDNGIITLQIDDEMKEFFLQLKEVIESYTKYPLKNILQFKGSYSFRIYELLKQQQKIGFRLFKIDELKEILDIPKDEYKLYAHFKSRVILPSQKEICEKTDICFNFEEYKENKKVVSIRFYINKKQKEENGEESSYSDEIEKVSIESVKSIIKEPLTDLEALELISIYNQNIDLLKEKYNIIKNSYSDASKIKNIMAILRDALQNPEKYQSPKQGKGSGAKTTFNNFKNREYDAAALEEELLKKSKTELL